MHSCEYGSSNLKAFGALLRFHRERAGLSQEALGRRVGYSKSQVAMVERGERPPKGKLVLIADETLGAQGALLTVAEDLNVSHLPSWFEGFVKEEARCLALQSYVTHVIPGLLQTEAYARAVFGCNYPPLDDEEIEAFVATRLQRQQLLRRKPTPDIGFVLESIALSRPIGGSLALKEQLHQVLEIGAQRNVQIQVMPPTRETHAGLDGPMTLLTTPERRQLAYIEGQSGSYFLSEQADLVDLFGKYGILRAQALSPEESAELIEQVAHGL